MKKTLVLALILFFNITLYAQDIIKEKVLYESTNNAQFYAMEGFPHIVDLGARGFVIHTDGKFIRFDNELNKSWETESKYLSKTVKGAHNNTSEFVADHMAAYDIVQWISLGGLKPSEISVAAYSLEDGKASSKNIPLVCEKDTKILKFFGLSDGLYYFKVTLNLKEKIVTHFLGKVDLENGKVSETKLNLPYSAEELQGFLSSVDFEEKVFNIYNVGNDKIHLIKSSVDKKSDRLTITLGYIDKEGKYTSLAKSSVPEPDRINSFTNPSVNADTLNRVIYVTGYLTSSTGFKGIYFYTYSMETGNPIASKILFFDQLNLQFKPSERLDENIMFAETGMSYNYQSYKINSRHDMYNNLLHIGLVRRSDLVLGNGYKTIYINPDGEVTEIAKIYSNKNGVEKVVLYTDKTRNIKTSVDFYEAHYPIDKKKVSVNYINRKDYMILLDGREFKSKITAYKLRPR